MLRCSRGKAELRTFSVFSLVLWSRFACWANLLTGQIYVWKVYLFNWKHTVIGTEPLEAFDVQSVYPG
jgi:hypothetical protein